MSKNLLARVAKLEAAKGSGGRIVPLFVGGGDKAAVEAKQAEMIRTGQASPRDIFVVFRTIYEEPPQGRGWLYQ